MIVHTCTLYKEDPRNKHIKKVQQQNSATVSVLHCVHARTIPNYHIRHTVHQPFIVWSATRGGRTYAPYLFTMLVFSILAPCFVCGPARLHESIQWSTAVCSNQADASTTSRRSVTANNIMLSTYLHTRSIITAVVLYMKSRTASVVWIE